MSRTLKTLGLALCVAAALAVLPAAVQAQVIVVQSPPAVVSPAPVIQTYYPAPVYAAPSISYSAPIVTSYSGTRVAYYAAPVYQTYSVPVAVTPAPGVYTTYTYRNGLGIFRPRFVNQTYYTPVP
jgi:hypothetical protein